MDVYYDIVPTDVYYTSDILAKNLDSLLKKFTFLQSQIIGRSVLNKPIYAVRLRSWKKIKFYMLELFIAMSGYQRFINEIY